MTEYQRKLIMNLVGGEAKLLPVIHQMYAHTYCDVYFDWLRLNGYFGSRLWEWFNINHGASANNMMRYITASVKRNNSLIDKT